MAYRNFRNEELYAPPEISNLGVHTLNTVQGIMQERAQKRKQTQDALSRFHFDVGKGYFAGDQEILKKSAGYIVPRAIDSIKRNNGQLGTDIILEMQDHESLQNQMRTDWDTVEKINAKLKQAQDDDKYYIGGNLKGGGEGDDLKMLAETIYNGPINERSKRLKEVQEKFGGLSTFDKGLYTADYIDKQKSASMQQTVDKDGFIRNSMSQAIFMDGEVPGVSENAVIKYVNSEPRIAKFYQNEVDKEMADEVKYIKNKINFDGKLSEQFSGLDDNEIKHKLIDNPELNPINKSNYGERQKELAKKDLEVGQRINHKVSTNYSNRTAPPGAWSNPDIKATPVVDSSNINVNGQQVQSGSAGTQMLIYKVPIQGGGTFHNVGTGKTEKSSGGIPDFTVTGQRVHIYDSQGNVIPFQGNTIEEMKAGITNAIKIRLPDSTKPNVSSYGLMPTMEIGLHGHYINRNNSVRQEINNKESDLYKQLNQAKANGDVMTVSLLERDLKNFSDLSKKLGDASIDDLEISALGKQLGLSSLQSDLIVRGGGVGRGGPDQLAGIKNITSKNKTTGQSEGKGLDLRDRSQWTDEQRILDDHYQSELKRLSGQPLLSPEKNKAVKEKAVLEIKTKPPTKKEIKRSDIAVRAKAAGLTEKQYEETIKKNGVKVID